MDSCSLANSRRHWLSTPAVCQSAEADCTALPTERFCLSVRFAVAARQLEIRWLTAFVTQS